MKNAGQISEFDEQKCTFQEIKSNLQQQKTQIFLDFASYIEEIKKIFEEKLENFVKTFDSQLSNIEITISLIKKNQKMMPNINQSLDSIIKNFEYISHVIEEKLHPKPKKQRYLSVHFDKNQIEQLVVKANSQSNEAVLAKTIRTKNSFEILEKNQDHTIINTPSLLLPPPNLQERDVVLTGSQDVLNKLNDNLEDLKRKSSIFSYEELVKRPRSTTKNTRPETFAKMYLAEMYMRANEMVKILDIANSKVKGKHK